MNSGATFFEWALPDLRGPAWQALGDAMRYDSPLCAEIDPEAWFAPHGGTKPSTAQLTCLSCKLLTPCRDAARESEEPYGTWGGESQTERERWLERQKEL